MVQDENYHSYQISTLSLVNVIFKKNLPHIAVESIKSHDLWKALPIIGAQ